MKRLTERDEFGNADIIGVDSVDLQLNLTYPQFNRVTEALNRLAAYEDAEEQGLLVRLPCKVGDTVFRIWNGEIEQYQVVSVWFNDHIKRRFHAECFPFLRFYDEDIGKRVFFTHEEAEAALTKEG